jgi:ribokinase
MRVAVVGHVERVEFARVDHVPQAGEIVQAVETWTEAAGAAAVAASQMRKLGGDATLFTALGDDELGHRAKLELEALGLRVEAVFRPGIAQRRGFAFIDASGERTITTIGQRLGPSGDDPLPWTLLDGADAVYFTAGDEGALRAARAAKVLTATSRVMAELAHAQVPLDAVIGSAHDANERYVVGALQPPPKLVVLTAGNDGGTFTTADGRTGSWKAVEVPGPVSDFYGSGDSFAGGVTFGLGEGLSPEDALALGARCGAANATGRGGYEGQLRR